MTVPRNLQPLLDSAYAAEVQRRLLSNVEISPNGCWEWQRFKHPDGYGKISVKSRMASCHQVAVFLHRGPWDTQALQVDHLCRNRACCNPEHLELVTAAENTRRRTVEMEHRDTAWMSRGNCVGVDPDLFFPERGASVREAKEVCRACLVRVECLEYALERSEKFGIWGGLSERERRRLRAQRKGTAA